MSPAQQTIKLVETKEIERFIPIIREIDFGDRFLLSVLHWCGIGQRSTPLEYWKVFLLQSDGEIVGISGLYRQPEMPSHVCWLGWFAIRPRFRRRGLGSAAIHQLFDAARSATSRSFGSTPAPTTTSLEAFTRVSALNSSAQPAITHLEELWTSPTLY
jgi:GNAT superfamily N-acetyltransferase